MNVLKFKTEDEANATNNHIWCCILKIASTKYGGTLTRHSDMQDVDLDSVPDSELLSDYYIYSISKGVRVYNKALTRGFAEVFENEGSWFIPNPQESHPSLDWDTELSPFTYEKIKA